MRKTIAILIAGVAGLTSTLTLADDKTPSDYTIGVQTQLKREADAQRLALAKMTPQEKQAWRKARNAETQKSLDTIIKLTQDPKDQLHMQINRTAAASMAGPTPIRGMNTPEWDRDLKQERGQ